MGQPRDHAPKWPHEPPAACPPASLRLINQHAQGTPQNWPICVQSLTQASKRGVSDAEREIGVGLNEVGHAVEVGGGQRDEGEDVVPDRAQEPGLSLCATLTFQQVAHVSQDWGGHQQGSGGIIEQGHAASVMAVLLISHGHRRASVPDDHSTGPASGRTAQLRAQNVVRALSEVGTSTQRPGPGGASAWLVPARGKLAGQRSSTRHLILVEFVDEVVQLLTGSRSSSQPTAPPWPGQEPGGPLRCGCGPSGGRSCHTSRRACAPTTASRSPGWPGRRPAVASRPRIAPRSAAPACEASRLARLGRDPHSQPTGPGLTGVGHRSPPAGPKTAGGPRPGAGGSQQASSDLRLLRPPLAARIGLRSRTPYSPARSGRRTAARSR